MHSILKKFVKHLASGQGQSESIPYDKLLNIIENLCRAHRNKSEKDMAFLFVKALFMDGMLENTFVKTAILFGDMKDVSNLESLFHVEVSTAMRDVVA